MPGPELKSALSPLISNNYQTTSSSSSSSGSSGSSDTVLILGPNDGQGSADSSEQGRLIIRVDDQSLFPRPSMLPVDYDCPISCATHTERDTFLSQHPFSSQRAAVSMAHLPRRDLGSRGGTDLRYIRSLIAEWQRQNGIEDPEMLEEVQGAVRDLMMKEDGDRGRDGIGNSLVMIEFFAFLFEGGHAVFGYKNIFDLLSQVCEGGSCLTGLLSAFLILRRLGTVKNQADEMVQTAKLGASRQIAEKLRTEILDEVKEQRDALPPAITASLIRLFSASTVSGIEWLGRGKNPHSSLFWLEVLAHTGLILTGLPLARLKEQEAKGASEASKKGKEIRETCQAIEETTASSQIIPAIKNQQNRWDNLFKVLIFKFSKWATLGESALSLIRLAQLIVAHQQSIAIAGGNHPLGANETTAATTTTQEQNLLFSMVNTFTISLITLGLVGSAGNILINIIRDKMGDLRKNNLNNALGQTATRGSEKGDLARKYLTEAENQIREALEPFYDANENLEETAPLEPEHTFYDAVEDQPHTLPPGVKEYLINTLFEDYGPVGESVKDFNGNDLLRAIKDNPQFFEKENFKQNLEALIPELTAFRAATQLAEDLIKEDPHLAIGNLIHDLATDFRGNKDRVTELLRRFDFSEEDIRLFTQALEEDPNAQKIIRDCIATKFNVAKSLF